MTKVFIDGREGTTGLRIQERLSARNDITLLDIASEDRKKLEVKARLYKEADIVFFCLPDAAAKEAAGLVPEDVTVIDTSTAHRVAPGWAYGFAELSKGHRSAIAEGKRIANPGCHASGFISLVYPLTAAGVLPIDYPLTCYSLTGYSGGGRKMITQYEAPDRDTELDSPRQYGLSQAHKHLPEMQKITGLEYAPSFCPIVSDYYAGMEVTVPLHTRLMNGKPSKMYIYDILSKHYAGSKLVKVLCTEEDPKFFGSNNMAGRDSMEILVTGNDERVLLISRFDNLGKGASGAAIQCMNISMGLDETTGLVL